MVPTPVEVDQTGTHAESALTGAADVPLLAQSGHTRVHCTCLLSGVKRTCTRRGDQGFGSLDHGGAAGAGSEHHPLVPKGRMSPRPSQVLRGR
jgi:hypothetical protein